jgi:hypothetical protein
MYRAEYVEKKSDLDFKVQTLMKIRDSSYSLLDLTVAIIACLQIRLFGHGLFVETIWGSSPYLIRARIPMYDHVRLTLTTSRKIIRDQLVSSHVYYKILVFLCPQVRSDLCLRRVYLWSLSGGVTFYTKRSYQSYHVLDNQGSTSSP